MTPPRHFCSSRKENFISLVASIPFCSLVTVVLSTVIVSLLQGRIELFLNVPNEDLAT